MHGAVSCGCRPKATPNWPIGAGAGRGMGTRSTSGGLPGRITLPGSGPLHNARPGARHCRRGRRHSVTGVLAPRPMTEAGLPLANAYNDRSWASVE